MCHHLTESTMWFASYVRAIKTRPTMNEELDGVLVDSLCAETDNLKTQLDAGGSVDVHDAFHATELLHAKHSTYWDDEIDKSQTMNQMRDEMTDRRCVQAPEVSLLRSQ